MAAAVLVAALLQVVVPHRGRVAIWWVFPVVEVIVLGVVIVRDPGRIDRRSRTLRLLTLWLIGLITVANTVGAIVLLYDILTRVPDVNASTLLGRGAAIWVTNIIVFSLWFWELDRGGPAERAAGSSALPTFAFPENATPELVPEGWIPTFPDYLFLSFTTATAFSPTDTLPLKVWAKMTMMVESSVSLALAVLVVSRAINILP
jgi:hypothetical protein